MKRGRDFYNKTLSFMNRIGYKSFSPDVLFNGIQDETVFKVLSLLIEDEETTLLDGEDIQIINELVSDNVFPSCYYYSEKIKKLSFLKQGEQENILKQEDDKEIEEIQKEKIYENNNLNELEYKFSLAESLSFDLTLLIQPFFLNTLMEFMLKVSEEVSLKQNIKLNTDFCNAMNILLKKNNNENISTSDLKFFFQLKIEVLLKETVLIQNKELEKINQQLQTSLEALFSVFSFIQLSILYLNEKKRFILELKKSLKIYQEKLFKVRNFLNKLISFLDKRILSITQIETKESEKQDFIILETIEREMNKIKQIKKALEGSIFFNMERKLYKNSLREEQIKADQKIKILSTKIQNILHKY